MQNTMTQEELFKKLVAHCKEYGFIFPSSEIYDGLGAVYDYGQNGVELKNNIKRYWWDSMVRLHENIVGLDSAIFMHPRTWEASERPESPSTPICTMPSCTSRMNPSAKMWWRRSSRAATAAETASCGTPWCSRPIKLSQQFKFT